jgi:hypothetical protein
MAIWISGTFHVLASCDKLPRVRQVNDLLADAPIDVGQRF